jgi:methylglutaconyl-CoA hydratase
MHPFVSLEIKNQVGEITFFHPAGNSFPSGQLKDFVAKIEEADSNKDVKVILIKSEGTTFCAGASFDELLAINNFEDGTAFFSGFAYVINALRKVSKITVVQVQGKAVGGGVGIISACDYAVATENASVKLSELAIGIGPFVIEPAVSKKIGTTATSALTLGAHDWKSAQWAYQKGLYTELVNTEEELNSQIEKITSHLCSYNQEALSEWRKVQWQNTDNWDTLLFERAKISGKLVLSDFTKNALEQFKRKP